MTVMSNNMEKQRTINPEIREDAVKILGYLASACLFLVMIFTVIYIYVPNAPDRFSGIPWDFPYRDSVESLVLYAINSISSWYTYVFLVLAGIITYVAGQVLEKDLNEETGQDEEQAETTETAKPKPEKGVSVIKQETIPVKPAKKDEAEMVVAGKNSRYAVIKQSAKTVELDEEKETGKKTSKLSTDTAEVELPVEVHKRKNSGGNGKPVKGSVIHQAAAVPGNRLSHGRIKQDPQKQEEQIMGHHHPVAKQEETHKTVELPAADKASLELGSDLAKSASVRKKPPVNIKRRE